MARLLGWEVYGQRYEGESEAWADGEVSASDLRQLAGSPDSWDQAGMSATSARSTARTAARSGRLGPIRASGSRLSPWTCSV